MPLYEYRCTACGREVEVVHAIAGSGPGSCEACGGTMRKAVSAPAIHFKGSGWAKKDAATARKPAPAPDASTKDAGGGEAKKEAGGAKSESTAKGTDHKATVSAGDTSG